MMEFLKNRMSKKSEIDQLISLKISENIFIEYKSELPGKKDADKKEFAIDILSFLNAMGGKIIFGIEEKGGLPISIKPLNISDRDAEQLRLNQILLSCIEPRGNIEFNWIELTEGAWILELIIPPSPNLPHRVFLNNHEYFWIRDAAGKHRMSMDEIRDKFQGFNIAKQEFLEQVLPLSNIFKRQAVSLIEKKFINCVFKGPANVMFSGAVSFNNIIDAEIVVVKKDATIKNAILFDKCIFQNCDLENVTLLLTPDQYNILSKRMKLGIPTIAGS
ncbi:helix-turn-helix domain-containing protein [Methylobacterium indicum]|uniref:AlbA family DNA-binding domain-containing protein n=1 Tax=Methylobacterium indicum TaxID=1775910 RepID=UPI00243560B1|nr:ATP-binding protein [Methylobacterium indicum]